MFNSSREGIRWLAVGRGLIGGGVDIGDTLQSRALRPDDEDEV